MTPAPPEGVDARSWAALYGPPIAHRGLWSAGVPENSLAAFGAAADAGYGIELDVRLSADGEAVVFHDDRLERMSADRGRVAGFSAEQLSKVRLARTDQTIPTLAQVLARVAGRGLVLVELKTLKGEEGPLEARVAEVLAGYAGPVGLLAFEAGALGWFADNRPALLRGLNLSRSRRDLSGLSRARPHFFSMDYAIRPDLHLGTAPVICWTVRSPADWDAVRPLCDNAMFEGFRPEVPA